MAAMFTHDCPQCRYLGSDNRHDHYVCESGADPDTHCLIARYASDGPGYLAAMTGLVRRFRPVDQDWALVKTLNLLEMPRAEA